MTALVDRPSGARTGVTAPSGPAGSRPPAPSGSAVPPSPPAPSRRRARLGLAVVTSVSLVLNCWGLSINGLGNQYYAAATRSMATSWHGFLFAGFDPGGFISVDKPPVALWIAALSARVFGVSPWSVLVPSAVAGAAAVALLWCIVDRRFGPAAATIAGAALALSPINVAVNRLNLPEPFLILFLVAAAWAVLRSIDARHPLRWVVLGGAFVGLAFNTKMLAAYIPVPALGLALVVGTRGWRAKIVRGAAFVVSTVACSVPWLVAVDLVSASSRPYVGGSTDNTVLDLVFGYNGFGRVNGGSSTGGGSPGGGLGGAMSAAGGIFGGSAGPWRLFSDAVGGQIAWLVPLAVVGLVAAAWLHRGDRQRRAAVVLWAGWLVLYAVIFSMAKGTFHSYYTSVMMPAVAALVGIGAASLVTLVRRDRRWFALVGAAAFATLALQLGLSGRHPAFYGWVQVPIVVLALGAAIGVIVGVARRRGRVVLGALAVALSAALVAPAAWAMSETANPVLNATLPQAGARSGAAATSFGAASWNGDAALAEYLVSQRPATSDGAAHWDLVAANAQDASGLIAYDDVSVLAIGGFMGTDRSITLDGFADLVAAGQVRFVLVGSTGIGGGARAGGAQVGGVASSILSVVAQVCRPAANAPASQASGLTGTVYDCAGLAGAIRPGP